MLLIESTLLLDLIQLNVCERLFCSLLVEPLKIPFQVTSRLDCVREDFEHACVALHHSRNALELFSWYDEDWILFQNSIGFNVTLRFF